MLVGFAQFNYTEGQGPLNGYLDYDQIPDVVINFDLPDRIVAAFGQAVMDGPDASTNRVWNLGFNMLSGRQYG